MLLNPPLIINGQQNGIFFGLGIAEDLIGVGQTQMKIKIYQNRLFHRLNDQSPHVWGCIATSSDVLAISCFTGLPRSSVAHHWLQPISGGGVCESTCHPVGMGKNNKKCWVFKWINHLKIMEYYGIVEFDGFRKFLHEDWVFQQQTY